MPASTAYLEPIAGRYLHLELGGRPHRVYFEEAGSGDPPSSASTPRGRTGASTGT